jgi:predicted nucleotidyltransferase
MFKNLNMLETPSFMILTFLGRNYRTSYYVRELASILPVSTGAASGYLRILEESGLVVSERKGRTLLFRADISHPLVRESKILATLIELSPLISAQKELVTRTILFGSCATGEDTAESDIDLYIETINRQKVSEIVSRFGTTISRKISPVILSLEEARQLPFRDRPFFERIRTGKLLAGEPL